MFNTTSLLKPTMNSGTTANSTPQFAGGTDVTFPSSGMTIAPPPMTMAPVPMTPVSANVAPAPVTVNVGTTPTAPTNPTASATQPTTQITPEQQVANSTYKNALGNAVSGQTPFNSSVLSSGVSSNTVLSSADKFYQEYLKNQQDYQSKLLGAMTPTEQEKSLTAKLDAQNTQAQLDQETALNSGETSAFAGGEAQRVNRNNAIQTAGLETRLQRLQSERATAIKGIEALINSNDKSFDTQYKIQQLQSTVQGVDKQAQDTFFNLQQSNPSVNYNYDKTKTAIDNLTSFRRILGTTTATQKSYQSDPTVSSLYNLGLITGGTEAERQSRANNIASLPQAQKDLTVQALAFNTLGPVQKTNFEANQRASQLAQNATSMVTDDMVNNPYKYTYNNNVGYIGGKKDLQYTNFIQNVQSVIAPIRLSYFGASLTTGEQESANQFLPDPKKDDVKALVLKLNNVDAIASFTNDTMIANALGTPKPKIDSYIKVEADGTPRPEWVREAYKNNYSKTEIEAFKKQQGFNSVGNTSASTTKSVVGGVDFKGYAVDPKQSASVATIYNKIPEINNEVVADKVIKQLNPNSSITGSQIVTVASKFNLDPRIMLALMKHESNLGTSSVAMKNNNYGGITWSPTYQAKYPNVTKGTARPGSEGGYYVKFPDTTSGLTAQAELLSRRKIA